MDLNSAINVAMNTAHGTPIFYLATSICQIRGIDPFGASTTLPIQNWQVIVAEQLLSAFMSDMLLDPRGIAK